MQVDPFLQKWSHFKLFSDENKTFCWKGRMLHDESAVVDLHSFNNTLVLCPSTIAEKRSVARMTMYDIITGKTQQTELKFGKAAVNCSNEKNLFVFSASIKRSGKQYFSMETFNIVNYNDFNSTKVIIDTDLIESNTRLYFHFAHFF